MLIRQEYDNEGNRLLGIDKEKTGSYIDFDYDPFDNLTKADYHLPDKVETIYRAPDAIGNLFESPNQIDRKYGKGGRLIEDVNYFYHYDVEGNLVFKEFKKPQGYSSLGKEAIEKKYGFKFKATATGWLYEWDAGGMLRKVVNPQQGKIHFGYDALGRRTYKEVKNRRTNWLWDGNVPLHEWQSTKEKPEIDIDIITWVFEDNSFVPCARITGEESHSIVTDYLGTPTHMYDTEGNNTWHAELDIYGRVRTFEGSSLKECPFRYQGQYQDEETGLYYNRFRYYDPEIGNYISQNPIGLTGNNPSMYGYVHDINSWAGILGLSVIEGQVGTYKDLSDASETFDAFQIHHIPQDKLGYLPRNDGIVVVMTDADHAKTRTFKFKGRVTAAIDKNKAFKDVLKDDLIDLHKIGGGKFDNSIDQIIKEYENLGMLKKGELTLIKIKKASH